MTNFISGKSNAKLIALWEFDEADGNVAYDSISNKECLIGKEQKFMPYDGKFSGAIKFLTFKRSEDIEGLQVKNYDMNMNTNVLTLSVWVYIDKILDFGNRNMLLFLITLKDSDLACYFAVSNQLSYIWDRDDEKVNKWIINHNIVTNEWMLCVLVIQPDKTDIWLCDERGCKRDTNIKPNTLKRLNRLEIGDIDYANYMIDDAAVFDHALCENEIRQLYELGGKSFLYGDLKEIYNSLLKIEDKIEQQEYKLAKILIDEKMRRLDLWKNKEGDIQEFYEKIKFKLFYLLAEIQKVNKENKGEILKNYNEALKFQHVYLKELGDILFWIYSCYDFDIYKTTILGLSKYNPVYLKSVELKAKELLSEKNISVAKKFIEDSLIIHESYKKKTAGKILGQDYLPELYYQLAQINKNRKSSKKDLAENYIKVFEPSLPSYTFKRIESLEWLLQHPKYCDNKALVTMIRQGNQENLIDIFKKVFVKYRSDKDLPGLYPFLNTLLSGDKYPYMCMIIIRESCKGNYNNYIFESIRYVINQDEKLKIARKCVMADEYYESKDYQKAYVLYKIVLNSNSVESTIADKLQLKICHILFSQGKYGEVIKQCQNIINSQSININVNNTCHLLIGKSYLHLADYDKAIKKLKLIHENNSEAIFYLGYCYSLMGNDNEAVGMFERLNLEHPLTEYSKIARYYHMLKINP